MFLDMLSNVITLLRTTIRILRSWGITQWKIYFVTIFVLDTSKNISAEASDAMIEVDTIIYDASHRIYDTFYLLFRGSI